MALVEEPGADWALAAAGPLAAAAAGGQSFAAADVNEAQLRQATRIVRSYLTREKTGLFLRGTMEESPSSRVVSEFERRIDGVAAAGAALANAAGAPAAKGWKSEAVEHYGRALMTDPAGAKELLRKAVDADPSLEDAWLRLAQAEATAGNRAAAADLLKKAPSTPKVRLLAASFSGDAKAKADAILEAVKANPADGDAWARLGAARTEARQYAEAADAYEEAMKRNQESGPLRNEAAYAIAAAGRYDRALEVAREYGKLTRGGNPLDTLGEIYVMAGRLSDAEKAFSDSHAAEPGFLDGAPLRKAAEVRRMTGDQKGADKLFDRYAESAAKHPLLPLFRAQWEYTSGRQDQAASMLASAVTPAARAQLAIWKIHQGDRAGATRIAEDLARSAGSPQDKAIAAMLGGVLTGNTNSLLLRALNKLFQRDFAAAIPLLEELDRASRPGQSTPVPVLLAWCYVETGRVADAKPLLASWPIPQSSGEAFFECLTFPRLLELRRRY